jgi:hypothetical protein
VLVVRVTVVVAEVSECVVLVSVLLAGLLVDVLVVLNCVA